MQRSKTFHWIVLFIWCGAIFYMSSRPDFSPAKELDTWAGAFELVSRKIAHLMEYSILFVLAIRAFRKTWPPLWRWHFLAAFLYVLLYSISDEWHQTFVPGRVGTVRDVFIDSLGAMIGFYYDLRSEKKKKLPPQNPAEMEGPAGHAG